ncbi:hypothetical protein M9H77_35987 [Catharanthus roseus]|uniref:Uncharacterized protein n=1 Tax=Catharanthus roseus TaxID=4058 RepID=A0ACB9ZUT4_CATRO|nr:hypothetical protein M9H77_35987 [Catharanthus roseus]
MLPRSSTTLTLIPVPFIPFTKCFVLMTLPILHHLLPEHLKNPNRPFSCGTSIAKKISHPVSDLDLPWNRSYMIAKIWVAALEDVLSRGGFQAARSVEGAIDDDGCVIDTKNEAGASKRACSCACIGRS